LDELSKDEGYAKRGVRALVIDVLEPEKTAAAWAGRLFPDVPVLLDSTGEVATAYAPVGVLPELPRSQVPIASNLIIDRQGRIRFFELLDSRNFDSQLLRLRGRLDDLLAAE